MSIDRGHRHFQHEMIESPGPRLMQAIRLNFVQERVRGRAGRGVNASLNLTSFIDFLIVVVVFLLMSFSGEGERPPEKSTRVPGAENTLDSIGAPMVSVAGTQVLVDGTPAGSIRAVEESGRLIKIEELHTVLTHKKELWRQLNPQTEFPGVVVMQIDRRVSAVVVKSVFQTAAFAGYPNVSFVVSKLPKSRP